MPKSPPDQSTSDNACARRSLPDGVFGIIPGPLVASLLLGDGRIAGIAVESTPIWIEHLDALDVLLVGGMDDVREVDPTEIEADRSPWPLDPCTPVARAVRLPEGRPVAE